METLDCSKRAMTGRHPIYQVADKLKQAFADLGFRILDNGEGCEIEKAGVSFATWAEPAATYGWQSDPIKMNQCQTILRTRILPAHLKDEDAHLSNKMVAFGRVYRNDEKNPMHHQMEGIFVEDGEGGASWNDLWQKLAVALFGDGATAVLKDTEDGTCAIGIEVGGGKSTYALGHAGPATEKTRKLCRMADEPAWVFIIDVDRFAQQYFGIEDVSAFYENDLAFLGKFPSESPAFGKTPASKAVDVLRAMGYQETCGDVFCTADTYKKMNMIQEAWDKNNQGYPLVEKLGDRIAMRTVLTPAIEETVAYNYERKARDIRIFEVGHIYLPQQGKILPKEHIAIAMGALGQDVTIESFKQEVQAFLKAMKVRNLKYVPTGMAAAYKWNECLLVMQGDTYIQGNFGQISRKAAENHDIDSAVYMANFELDALKKAAKKSR